MLMGMYKPLERRRNDVDGFLKGRDTKIWTTYCFQNAKPRDAAAGISIGANGRATEVATRAARILVLLFDCARRSTKSHFLVKKTRIRMSYNWCGSVVYAWHGNVMISNDPICCLSLLRKAFVEANKSSHSFHFIKWVLVALPPGKSYHWKKPRLDVMTYHC
jgi:hypothetical protein